MEVISARGVLRATVRLEAAGRGVTLSTEALPRGPRFGAGIFKGLRVYRGGSIGVALVMKFFGGAEKGLSAPSQQILVRS